MSRLEAEKRLRWQDAGVFLVRESESAPGEFSVSVRSVNAPHKQTNTNTRDQSDSVGNDPVVYSHIVMFIIKCCGAAVIVTYVGPSFPHSRVSF